MDDFTQAAGVGDVARMRQLVQQGADVDTQDALREAAEESQLEVVRFLAEHCGVDVNAIFSDGYTALMWAALNDDIELVQYLAQECGAQVDIQQKDGYSALLWAAQDNRIELARFLAEKCRANVNITNNDGYSALMLAAFNKNIDLVRYLAEECGADVNTQARDGKTALRIAADRGYRDIQRILTPFLLPAAQRDTTAAADCVNLPTEVLSSYSISPFEIELVRYSLNGNIGGDFRVKWLDADAVVKLFVPEASHVAFEDEVRLWQQLRHPNVTKMYGACDAGPHLKLFVCEYASNGSLLEHINLSSEEKPIIWKYLHEAALGLEYLHERGIVHGDLRCSTVLIGSDGLTKLANFGLSGSSKRPNLASSSVVGSMRWQAPEVLEGKQPSCESDVYSLGMCILEAATGKLPWANLTEYSARSAKAYWSPETNVDAPSTPDCLVGDAREVVWRMCCQDPRKRSSLTSIVYELERLAIQESSSTVQPDQEPATSVDDYELGRLKELWLKVQSKMQKCDNVQYRQTFEDIKVVHERLRATAHHPTVLARFDALVAEFYQTIKLSPEQAQLMRLSSTRATTTSLYALHWRINALLASLGEGADAAKERQARWQQQRSDQIEWFVSGVSDTFLLLSDLKSAEERSTVLRTLKAEMKNPLGKYSLDQLNAMKKTCEDIGSKLETEGLPELTPEWFIPWYELIVDEWNCLGAGGFGSVYLAKWLDSDVVVKQVAVAGSHDSDGPFSYDSYSSLSASMDPTASQAQLDSAKRAEALAMFRREVDIWFGLSHPHVVRLFGACHVGRPFFVCEYATNGTLVRYLRKYPDELWTKLLEAALGVQYLHARNVVHGDLKGNNIVIGTDMKAKVTDFGLSSVASDEATPLVSAALHWVAPECFGASTRPTSASDIYSLGMCIVEALRVVEAVNSGNTTQPCLPWGNQGNFVVKSHATKGRLPAQPKACKDNQWELVKRMCAFNPKDRIKISTVVDELAKLATTNNQHADRADNTPTNSVNLKCVPETIAKARRLVVRLRDVPGQRDAVLSLYACLWDRLEQVHRQIDGSSDAECRAAFCSLVADADVSTTELEDTKGNLVALAETTMRCYALNRTLAKLCDAYFLVQDFTFGNQFGI
ncbi:Serine/threonine-protein kinase TNNI3K [Phytophthora ramorum]|uniref:Serine/threonine-protein kinase TNNI3K n=1 Tax=Phytophthora ramorum TaxID=164328 RepID=UPI0030B406D4|nr:Serine/threonine-protein kinase TNNI3K [Phytophthora ramorum]